MTFSVRCLLQDIWLDGFTFCLTFVLLLQYTIRLIILGNAFLQGLLHQALFLFSLLLNGVLLFTNISIQGPNLAANDAHLVSCPSSRLLLLFKRTHLLVFLM